MPSSVMNFKDFFLSSSKFLGQSYRPVTLLRASAQQGRFIKRCIILYIVHILSSLKLVELHIIPLKVRLAVALKKEAK